jgi:hypothetical protein
LFKWTNESKDEKKFFYFFFQAENIAKVMTLNFTKKITMTQDSLNDFHLVIHTTQLLIQYYKNILNVLFLFFLNFLKTDEDLNLIREVFSKYTYDDRFNSTIEQF